MAYHVTHIVLSQKVYDKYFIEKDRRKFFVGTSFPDIRYLAKIDRHETHTLGLTIEEIAKKKAFMAGFKFHSYVDELRIKYVKESGIHELLPRSEYMIHALKFVEDLLLYEKVDNWQEFVGFFNDVLDEELALGVSRGDVEKWHGMIKTYISEKPNEKCLERMYGVVGIPKDVFNGVSALADELIKKEEVIQYVEDLYKDFE